MTAIRDRRIVRCGDCGQVRPNKARGICTYCYGRRWRSGTLEDRPKSKRCLTADELDHARLMLDDGCSYSEVARTLDVTVQSIAAHFPGRGWSTEQSNAHRRVLYGPDVMECYLGEPHSPHEWRIPGLARRRLCLGIATPTPTDERKNR